MDPEARVYYAIRARMYIKELIKLTCPNPEQVVNDAVSNKQGAYKKAVEEVRKALKGRGESEDDAKDIVDVACGRE